MYILAAFVTLKPDVDDSAADAFKRSAADIAQNEPGTKVYAVTALKREPGKYLLFEAYEDKDAFKVHMQRQGTTPASEQLLNIIASMEPIPVELTASTGL